ncbi:MAG TPA: O-antigen ligase family protein [Telmatospirillum sp.]|nr:O-antigen ligase family protein [Telmatospirillum sp.]
MIAFISGSETILGMDKWAYRGMLTGTFVNRNNYATDAGLTILCLAALAIRRFSGLGFRGVLRRLLVDGDKTSWLLLIGGLITLTSLLFSGSRAGCAATLFGAIGLALALMRFEGGRLIFGIGSLAVMGLSYYAIQSDTTGDGSSVFDDRLTLYWVTLGAIGEHPWTGTGLGSFSAVYGMIRPETFLAVWDNVHNTYLQLILELGVVAALSQLVAIGWLVWRCARGARSRRRNQVFPALGFAASVLVGSHVLVDFSLEIPAIAGLYAALLGIGVAQSWSSADPTAEG